jgi:hypothetical protein
MPSGSEGRSRPQSGQRSATIGSATAPSRGSDNRITMRTGSPDEHSGHRAPAPFGPVHSPSAPSTRVRRAGAPGRGPDARRPYLPPRTSILDPRSAVGNGVDPPDSGGDAPPATEPRQGIGGAPSGGDDQGALVAPPLMTGGDGRGVGTVTTGNPRSSPNRHRQTRRERMWPPPGTTPDRVGSGVDAPGDAAGSRDSPQRTPPGHSTPVGTVDVRRWSYPVPLLPRCRSSKPRSGGRGAAAQSSSAQPSSSARRRSTRFGRRSPRSSSLRQPWT